MSSRFRSAYSLALGAIYAVTANGFARLVADRFASANWFSVVQYCVTLVLLLAGFIVLARVLQKQPDGLRAMGWWWFSRNGKYAWQKPGGSAAIGAAMGWAMAVAIVLPLALSGNLYPLTDFSPPAFGFTFLALLGWLLAIAARETVFRGYCFQRLVELIGATAATLVVAIVVAILQFKATQETRGEIIYSIVEQIVLCVAVVRTGSLWASTALAWTLRSAIVALFGLPLLGNTPNGVVQSAATGPVWLGGAGSGPGASAFAPVIGFLALVAVFRLTERDPIAEIRGAGYPVDITARSTPNPVHAAYNDPPTVPLVQILPAVGPDYADGARLDKPADSDKP